MGTNGDPVQCTRDMAAIEAAVRDITDAMRGVNQFITATWVGTAADKWANDFNGRMGMLRRLFDSFPEEEKRLISQTQQGPSNPHPS